MIKVGVFTHLALIIDEAWRTLASKAVDAVDARCSVLTIVAKTIVFEFLNTHFLSCKYKLKLFVRVGTFVTLTPVLHFKSFIAYTLI